MNTKKKRDIFSPLETIVAFYTSGGDIGGYDICQKMEEEGLTEFFHFTKAAVYRALQRLEEEGYLKEAILTNGKRTTSIYKINAKGKTMLEKSILSLLKSFITKPEAPIALAMLGDISIVKSKKVVESVFQDLKERYIAVKNELHDYQGKSHLGRWAILGYEERRLVADLEWFRDMLESFDRDIARGMTTSFGSMPQRKIKKF